LQLQYYRYKGERFYQIAKYISLLCIVISLYNCAQWLGFPSYYDPTTYKNLTDLKPEVLLLYDTFKQEQIEEKKIAALRLKLAQIYEYEKGKGVENSDTTRQIEIIQQMFERHVKDRLEGGRWTLVHSSNVKENIAEAFDIAIRTERLKNKND